MSSSDTSVAVKEWHPARLLQDLPAPTAPYAVLALNQPLRCLWAIKKIWANASYRVAADGGANQLFDTDKEHFQNLDVVVGDLDSLRDDARSFFAAGSTDIVHDPEQESTDFTKAVWLIRERRPGLHIVALGGLGGRVDQGISQLHHLYMFQEKDRVGETDIFLLSSESLTFVLTPGKHRIHIREHGPEVPLSAEVFAQDVGILPMEGPSLISTSGLEWDVQNWDTRFGGRMSTSNHVRPESKVVEVSANKGVLFTIALQEPK